MGVEDGGGVLVEIGKWGEEGLEIDGSEGIFVVADGWGEGWEFCDWEREIVDEWYGV